MPAKYITHPNGSSTRTRDRTPSEDAQLQIDMGHAKCQGNKAMNSRLTKYKSANAAGEAMQMDPKTIRKIESGGPVRLKLIQSYAERLNISIDTILQEEYLESVQKSRAVLDYSNEDLFRSSNLSEVGLYDRYVAPGTALGQPCDATRFAELFSKMSAEPLDWPPLNCGPIIQPIWEIHESIPPSEEKLPPILEKLQLAISDTVMSKKSDLSSVIGQLKAQSRFKSLFEDLDKECGVHILGCIVTTHVITEVQYDDQFTTMGTDVHLPLLVIASNKVREFNLQYRHSLSKEDHDFQVSLLDPEDQAEFLNDVDDTCPF